MPIRHRKTPGSGKDEVRIERPRKKEGGAVPIIGPLAKCANPQGFEILKEIPGEDPLIKRRTKRTAVDFAKSLPYVNPYVNRLVYAAASVWVQWEYWFQKGEELGIETPEGRAAFSQANRLLGDFQKASLQMQDTSIKYAKGFREQKEQKRLMAQSAAKEMKAAQELQEIRDQKSEPETVNMAEDFPWIVTEGKDVEEDDESRETP